MTVQDWTPASPPSFGWLRAILSGLGITIALALVLLFVPELVLTRLTGLDRSTRVTIATTEFFVALALAAWALRKLQARGLI